MIRPGLTPSFGGEAHADEVKALAAANRIEADRYFHPFTPTVVNTGKELVLFDTGNGSLSRRVRAAQGPPAAGPIGRAHGAWPATSRRTSTWW